MKIWNKFLIVLCFVGFSSCDLFNLDLLENPNAVSPEKAEIDFLYNNIQLSFNNFFYSTYNFTARTSRMNAMSNGNTYNNAWQAVSFNGIWFNAYSTLFPDMDALLAISDANGLDIHGGSTRIMKAYVLATLADLFSDVPYSEALQGTDIISPKSDNGQDVYNAAFDLLDAGIAQLDGTIAGAPNSDIMYNGSADGWIKAANTIKLKMYLNLRLIDGSAGGKINELVQAGNIITSAGDDFQFNFGNNRANPNSRHPHYNEHYEVNDGSYMSNYFMWLLKAEKGFDDPDPRINFYFYRQDGDLTNEDPNVWECILTFDPFSPAPPHYTAVDPDMPYCIASDDGYFGRDHGNGAGIPPDGPIRARFGLYPCGGSFDDELFEGTQNNGTTGGLGQGIAPYLLSSYVYFMRAEAALMAGTSDNARDMLEMGIGHSMAKVKTFLSLVDPNKVVGYDPVNEVDVTLQGKFLDSLDVEIGKYTANVMAMYDAAANDTERLDIIIKEYMIALWGNGIENYNSYRRNAMPLNIQPMIEVAGGNFTRSALYPAVHVNLNANVSQRDPEAPVFWDNNDASKYR